MQVRLSLRVIVVHAYVDTLVFLKLLLLLLSLSQLEWPTRSALFFIRTAKSSQTDQDNLATLPSLNLSFLCPLLFTACA